MSEKYTAPHAAQSRRGGIPMMQGKLVSEYMRKRHDPDLFKDEPKKTGYTARFSSHRGDDDGPRTVTANRDAPIDPVKSQGFKRVVATLARQEPQKNEGTMGNIPMEIEYDDTPELPVSGEDRGVSMTSTLEGNEGMNAPSYAPSCSPFPWMDYYEARDPRSWIPSP